MKKEKTIRTYQRRTKTGKVVTVKQHTAKYDAAEALMEAAKKKGAGDELEKLKKKKPMEKPTEDEISEFEKLLDSFPDGLDERERKMRLKQFMKAKGKEGRQSEIDETKWEIKEEKKARKVWKANEKFGKNLEKSYEKEHKKSDTSYGFTADEYKAWYHWDQDADPKNKSALKVEKALKKQMGTKAYNKYFDEMSDNYSSRGHNKAFKGLGEKLSAGEDKKASTSASTKSVTPTKETKDESLKVGSSIQMGNSLNLGKGKKETFKVLAVQKTTKQDRELGNTEAAWVQRKDGSVTLALKDSEKGWMYDDTWTDFTDRKHPYAKSLEAAGYSFKKAQGKGGKYWEVSKGKETKADSSKIATPNSIEEIAKAKRDKEDAKKYRESQKVSKKAEGKRAKASIEGLKDPKRDAAKKEMARKDREYLKGVAKKAMFKNDPWFKRNGWTKQEKRNGNYSWISPDGNVSVPVTKLGMGAGKNFGTPKIKRSKE